MLQDENPRYANAVITIYYTAIEERDINKTYTLRSDLLINNAQSYFDVYAPFI